MATISPATDNNFLIVQGGNSEREYRWLLNDVAQDITGASIVAQFRKAYSDKRAVFVSSTDDGSITLTNPTNGEFQVSIPPAVSSEYKPKSKISSLEFDVEVSLAGRIDRIVEGRATFNAEVTR